MDRPDVTPDADQGQWLTYRQIGDLRRISKPSAERLVRRHRWRRQVDNQGVTRVLVPPDWLTEAPSDTQASLPDITPSGSPDITQDRELFAGALAALEGTMSFLQGQLDTANRRAEAAEAGRQEAISLAEKTVTMLTEERGRAEVAQQRADRAEDRADGLRRRVDELEVNLGAARTEAQRATETMAAMTRNEVARKARGRLRRAWDGWRGR
jgi:hypothetical protein